MRHMFLLNIEFGNACRFWVLHLTEWYSQKTKGL